MSEAEGYDYAVWTAEWKGDLRADVSARGHLVTVDEPPEFGGTNAGPMPTELLTAALASCMCLAVAWAGRKRRVELPDLEVQVKPHRAPGAPRYGRYEVSVYSSLAQEALEPLVELAKGVCWVTNTLHNPPQIAYRVNGG